MWYDENDREFGDIHSLTYSFTGGIEQEIFEGSSQDKQGNTAQFNEI